MILDQSLTNLLHIVLGSLIDTVLSVKGLATCVFIYLFIYLAISLLIYYSVDRRFSPDTGISLSMKQDKRCFPQNCAISKFNLFSSYSFSLL